MWQDFWEVKTRPSPDSVYRKLGLRMHGLCILPGRMFAFPSFPCRDLSGNGSSSPSTDENLLAQSPCARTLPSQGNWCLYKWIPSLDTKNSCCCCSGSASRRPSFLVSVRTMPGATFVPRKQEVAGWAFMEGLDTRVPLPTGLATWPHSGKSLYWETRHKEEGADQRSDSSRPLWGDLTKSHKWISNSEQECDCGEVAVCFCISIPSPTM